MRKFLLFGLFLLLLAGCSQTQLAPPDHEIDVQAKKESYRFSETTAEAYFSSEDDCSYTSLYVFVTEGKSKAGKAGGAETWAYASSSHFDWCAGTYVSASGSTSLPRGAFKANGGVNSASLKATITLFKERCFEEDDWWDCVYDEPGGVVVMDVNWKSSGKATRYKSSQQYHSPDSRFHYRSRGTFRNAVASGNLRVSLDEQDTTFGSSEYAWIGKSTQGFMYIGDSLMSQATNYRFSGNAAGVSHFNYDDCSYTSVDVFATESKFKAGKGQRDEGTWVDASIYHYDYCTDTYINAYGGTSLPKGALGIGGGLKTATVNTPIEFVQWQCGYDEVIDDWACTESDGVIDISLRLTGYGKTTRSKSSRQYHAPDYRSHYRSQGTFRNATVSGSISVSVNESTLTVDSFDYAWIGKSKEGSMYVFK